jgi:hypothetical protein
MPFITSEDVYSADLNIKLFQLSNDQVKLIEQSLKLQLTAKNQVIVNTSQSLLKLLTVHLQVIRLISLRQ